METKKIGEEGGKCNQNNCFRKATEGVVVGKGRNKQDVYFCDEHIEGALEVLA